MAKYENIRELAKKQLQAVTESSDKWKAFLQTAAIAYTYSFPNQLLIYGQNPTATAVADMDYWNKSAGRRVKRGAHGTAVFDTRANSPRLRYLFDISDTIPIHEIPEALPWVITDQNWKPVWDKIIAGGIGKGHRRQQLTVGQAGGTATTFSANRHPKLPVYGRTAVRR